jgi:5'(3')-deoxyribonucleotidase
MRNGTKRPIVLLDCDGVLADFIGGVLEIVEHTLGLAYKHEDVDRFDFCAALSLAQHEARAVKSSISTRGFCSSLVPYDGAKRGVAALEEIADVYIVTSPWDSCETWEHERKAWLYRHFKIPSSRVIHTSAKHLVCGDVFVDDKTSAVAAWREAWRFATAVRWNTPHNARDEWNGRICTSWDSLNALVAGIAEEVREPDAVPVAIDDATAETARIAVEGHR